MKELGVSKIVLTGSGGPFRYTPLNEFEHITPEQAVAHPNWSMGKKISVDSATMMNKGLEYIEARWLFNASAEDVYKRQVQVCSLTQPRRLVYGLSALFWL